jgi:hypothetical protein
MTVTLREAWAFCVLRPCPMKLGALPAVKDLVVIRWGMAATGIVATVLIVGELCGGGFAERTAGLAFFRLVAKCAWNWARD